MSTSARLNLLLLVIAIALGGYIASESFSPAPPPAAPVSALEADAVTRLTLRRPDQHDVILTRRDRSTPWQMQQPWSVAADGHRIDRLLGLMQHIPTARYPLADIEPGKLGFQADSESLELQTDKGHTETLIFGSSHPMSRERYIRNDDQILLTADLFLYLLRSQATDYVSPYLLPRSSRIERLEIPGLSLSRSSDGWQVEPPLTTNSADASQILIDHWQAASALRVSTVATTDSPRGKTVRVTLAGDRTLDFMVINDAGETRLLRTDIGLAWHFQPDQWLKMTQPPATP